MPEVRTYAASSMHISRSGLDFIYRHEYKRDITEHLHWPEGDSGVTIGPGYDIKLRKKHEIISDLRSVGVPQAAAEIAAQGATLTGLAAQSFCLQHRNLISLTDSQQRQLLQKIVPQYEDTVKRIVDFPNTQYQFDALVSLAFNAEKSMHPLTRATKARYAAEVARRTAEVAGRKADAAKHATEVAKQTIDVERDWLSRTHSGGRNMGGLGPRRKNEINLFENGAYN